MNAVCLHDRLQDTLPLHEFLAVILYYLLIVLVATDIFLYGPENKRWYNNKWGEHRKIIEYTTEILYNGAPATHTKGIDTTDTPTDLFQATMTGPAEPGPTI